MKVNTIQDFSQVDTLTDLIKFSSQAVNEMVTVINGKIDFVSNCDTSLIGVSFVAANVQYAFPHSLGRTPTGYLPVALSANMTLFSGQTPNTAAVVYLQSSAIGNAKVLVF